LLEVCAPARWPSAKHVVIKKLQRRVFVTCPCCSADLNARSLDELIGTLIWTGNRNPSHFRLMPTFQFIVGLYARPGKAHGGKSARRGYQRTVCIPPTTRCRRSTLTANQSAFCIVRDGFADHARGPRERKKGQAQLLNKRLCLTTGVGIKKSDCRFFDSVGRREVASTSVYCPTEHQQTALASLIGVLISSSSFVFVASRGP
jgi:hypothetical protein